MVNIADDLVRATELIRKFARDGWDHTMDSTDRDALVWLLEVAGGQHAQGCSVLVFQRSQPPSRGRIGGENFSRKRYTVAWATPGTGA
jgi:hypothetical protein